MTRRATAGTWSRYDRAQPPMRQAWKRTIRGRPGARHVTSNRNFPDPASVGERDAPAGVNALVNTGGQARHPAATKRLMRFWAEGEGAQLIRWGHDGDFDRCVVEIQKAVTKGGHAPLPDHEIKGLCRNLHVRATGAEPGHAPGESRPGSRH